MDGRSAGNSRAVSLASLVVGEKRPPRKSAALQIELPDCRGSRGRIHSVDTRDCSALTLKGV